jgi:acyl-CoA synthetase (AMP-forming)/AMP-acid ligase II
MLYERWRQISRDRRDELALRDLESERVWTFGQLDAAVQSRSTDADPVVFPQGHSAEFILVVLRAWRNNQAVCPLEPSQPAPALTKLPPGCVHLKTTSATTGRPRVVAFTAEQLMADAENIVATMGLRPDWPNLGVISLAHSYGFSNLVTPLLLHGIPLLLVPGALPEVVRRSATNTESITLAAVPALWRTWHEATAIPANVRLAISAGAPLPLTLEQAVFATAGPKIHNFYGSSECGGIAYDDSETPRSDGACVGRALHNVRLSQNADGCLEVRSRAVASTYWPQPEPVLHDGCFKTSDLVELKEGLVFLRGRLSEQINAAGRKVSPEAIERVLLTCPGVRDCLVFGLPDGGTEREEIIVACVASSPPLATGALREHALTTLPAWQVPRRWIVVESLPVNERGKISRAEWRERLLAERKPRLDGVSTDRPA